MTTRWCANMLVGLMGYLIHRSVPRASRVGRGGQPKCTGDSRGIAFRVAHGTYWHTVDLKGRDRAGSNNMTKIDNIWHMSKRVPRLGMTRLLREPKGHEFFQKLRCFFQNSFLLQMGWHGRRSSSREESNHLSFLRSLRRIAIACWSCMLERHKPVWRPHLCLSRVGPP